jgi:hypothetical protein
MIKPLFEMKETVDKTNQSISELYKKSEIQKNAIDEIANRLDKLEKIIKIN